MAKPQVAFLLGFHKAQMMLCYGSGLRFGCIAALFGLTDRGIGRIATGIQLLFGWQLDVAQGCTNVMQTIVQELIHVRKAPEWRKMFVKSLLLCLSRHDVPNVHGTGGAQKGKKVSFAQPESKPLCYDIATSQDVARHLKTIFLFFACDFWCTFGFPNMGPTAPHQFALSVFVFTFLFLQHTYFESAF